MNKVLDSKNKTLVKIVVIGWTLLSLSAHAQNPPAAPAATAPAQIQTPPLAPQGYGGVVVDAAAQERMHQKDRDDRRCAEVKSETDRARTRLSELCRKSGLGGSTRDCENKSLRCAEVTSGESFDTLEAIGMALGLPAGSTQSASNSCPQLSGKDYFSEKDKIQKEIKDIERDLADLNDDKAEIQDKYNQDMLKMQEDLAKAQEDYKKLEEQLDEEERERIAAFNEAQNSAKERMRQLGTDILDLQGQLVQAQRQRAIELNALSDSAGKRKCMTEVNKMKADYEKTYAKNSFSSSNHIAQAKKKRTELIDFYNTCMNDFNQQRISLNEKNRATQDRLEKSIRDKQSSLDEVENSLSLASSQLEEMKQSTMKKKSNALQAVVDMGTRMQQQMQAAYSKLQENLKTIATKTTSLTSALNRANASLMTLGPAPTSRSSEYAPSEVSGEIGEQAGIIADNASDYAKCGYGSKSRGQRNSGGKEGTR